MKTKTLKGFSKYEVNEQGQIQSVKNKKVIQFDKNKSIRLVDDKGNRKSLSVITVKKMTEKKSHKLSNDQAKEIRTLYSEGTAQSKIAVKFSVHASTVSEIVNNIYHKC